jgi:hypothetical protein
VGVSPLSREKHLHPARGSYHISLIILGVNKYSHDNSIQPVEILDNLKIVLDRLSIMRYIRGARDETT